MWCHQVCQYLSFNSDRPFSLLFPLTQGSSLSSGGLPLKASSHGWSEAYFTPFVSPIFYYRLFCHLFCHLYITTAAIYKSQLHVERQSKKQRRLQMDSLTIVLSWSGCIYADGIHLLVHMAYSELFALRHYYYCCCLDCELLVVLLFLFYTWSFCNSKFVDRTWLRMPVSIILDRLTISLACKGALTRYELSLLYTTCLSDILSKTLSKLLQKKAR